MKHVKSLRTAASIALAAAAICAPLGGAMAFEGQKPGAPAKPGAAAPTVMAPAGGGASTANAPNGNPIQTGGIRADQLAADQDALDKMMFGAIEASNPDEVRNVLKAGINLRQNFQFACVGVDFSHNYEAEAKLLDIGVKEGILGTAVPGHCSKQHVFHALIKALEVYPGPAYQGQTNGNWRALLEDKLGEPGKNPFVVGEEKQKAVAAADAGRRAFEVLALLDANIPVADKAFYLSYLREALVFQKANTFVAEWTITKFDQALPEIKRARGLKEPGRLAWDQYKAKQVASSTQGSPFVGSRHFPMFDPSVAPGGDDRMTWKPLAESTFIRYGDIGRGPVVGACSLAWTLEKRPGTARQMEMAELNKRHFYDYVDRYSLEGLASHGFGAFAQDALKVLKPNANDAAVWGDAIQYFGARHMIAFMLAKPEVVSALGNEQVLPGGNMPPFHAIAGRDVGGASPSLMRAMLNAGVNPGTRDANGKTAADVVIGTSPLSLWRAQAFTKKDLVDPGCAPRG